MKSKYSSVIKLRKQELDKAEANLTKTRQKISQCEEELKEAIKTCESLNLVDKGSIILLRSSLKMQEIARDVKKSIKQKLDLFKKELAHNHHLYKRAYLEFEKMKALENEELKKIKKILQKEEEKFVDELAITRHFNKDNQ
ncbi:flagellar FliJ family protein [Campylobacter insulaenigrae]|uniref:flagellar FliJ family protein n=1 Tax=Campylobacter insulaenigrae TaxID=260714 RepID=UPI0021534D18|nr:flagellar FliJ family protein [Campylobacter insulaenigrae]MCR6570462.1 flagellar FliJ family protein [Campylobacter insulaenigrae]